MNDKLRVMVSGGGTGGHIFPAIAIADAVRALVPDAELLFVGAEGRMEMQRVPAAGYKIVGLPVAGLDRRNWLKNVGVLWKLWKSGRMARKIVSDFRPDVVVGVGGYASGPALRVAQDMGIPTLLQEQNSFAGVANRLLAKRADRICVAYDGMERFFPKDRIVKTGNPVRDGLLKDRKPKETARLRFKGLREDSKTVLIVGGSLGARTLNECVLGGLDRIRDAADVQVIWQTGRFYSNEISEALKSAEPVGNLLVTDFLADMGDAYAAADLVVSRAGASSISELCLLGKPCILVPSPNVAEDHQTKNARALSERDAALLIADGDARDRLIDVALETVRDDVRLARLSENILKLALPDSARMIAEEVLRLAKVKSKK